MYRCIITFQNLKNYITVEKHSFYEYIYKYNTVYLHISLFVSVPFLHICYIRIVFDLRIDFDPKIDFEPWIDFDPKIYFY